MNIKDFILKYSIPPAEAEGLKEAAKFWARSNFEEKLLILVYCLTFGTFPGGVDAESFEEELLNNFSQFINDDITSPNLLWSSLKTNTEISNAISNLSTAIQSLISDSIMQERTERENADQNLSGAILAEIENREYAVSGVQTDLSEHENRNDNPHSVTKEQVGLGNVLNVLQLTEADVIDSDTSSSTNKPVSAAQVASLRQSLNAIQTLLNSDDTDLDTFQEIVNFIKANKDIIDEISTSKIPFSDIVDDFDSELADKVASAGTVYRLNQNKRNNGPIPASDISTDLDHQFVTQAEKDDWSSGGGGGSGELQLFIYQPGGTASGNVFTDWALLYSAISSLQGFPKTILLDSSFLSTGNQFVIPNETYDFDFETTIRMDKGSLLKNASIDLTSDTVLFTGMPTFQDCVIDVTGRSVPLVTKAISFLYVNFKNSQFIWDNTTSCAFLSISKDPASPFALAQIVIDNNSSTYDSNFQFIEIHPNVTVYVDAINETLLQGSFAVAGGLGGTISYRPDASALVESSVYAAFGGSSGIYRKSLRTPNFDSGSEPYAESGSAPALPANPAGYLKIFYQNAPKVIPFYDPPSP
ncbi:hypothetical protein [Leptospira licerasiae]|uniref:hypothetical protein n=1 Tax=Leptospira licerasiae TaxID=447106 RepID=UPI00108452ED|nr:hypothetical protein [Leptospira licerasiae]TGM88488.1 hypothetical protein EHR05_13475 [Leptospira licerasiae]